MGQHLQHVDQEAPKIFGMPPSYISSCFTQTNLKPRLLSCHLPKETKEVKRVLEELLMKPQRRNRKKCLFIYTTLLLSFPLLPLLCPFNINHSYGLQHDLIAEALITIHEQHGWYSKALLAA